MVFTLQSVARRHDGYRHSLWIASADGVGETDGEARQLTLGAKHDRMARFSPDGRSLAFLSDRRAAVEDEAAAPADREDAVQIHVLPLAGGEAHRVSDLPLGVDAFEWSPDGTRFVALSSSVATRDDVPATRVATDPPESDYHYIDRLAYLFNGRGYVYHRRKRLWLVDAMTGSATRLTGADTDEQRPVWSPDGTRIAFAANRRPDPDLHEHLDVFVVDVATGVVTQVTGGGEATFTAPEWLPDNRTLAVLGHRFGADAGTRTDAWLFAADGSDNGPTGGRNLSAAHDRMLGSGFVSDLTSNEEPRLVASPDGAWLTLLAPEEGGYDICRLATIDGRLERLTSGQHVVSSFDQVTLPDGSSRIAYIQSDGTHPSEIHVQDGAAGSAASRRRPHSRRLTRLNDEALRDIATIEPLERWVEVDGRRIQGWLFPAVSPSPSRPSPLVAQIHGGPHAFYSWAPTWEFQVLAGAGMSVFACNPRGSDGYGEAFNAANHRDWGHGPMRDVLAGIDALVAEGLADPKRLGVTGGSYGGYLTNWILAHDQRFRAGLTARCVSDMAMLMLTGDISGGEFGRLEFGVAPWEDPGYYREISPLTYASAIHTPLLIQHSERDLRTTIGQAEALFTVLRSLRRPVRFMRVPEETHELIRSGTPFRRVENLVQVRDWFAHFLVKGRRTLPPIPAVHGGR